MTDEGIRIYGDPLLHRRAKQIKKLDRRIRRLVKSMFSTMYRTKGVGLAAPQVGLGQQLIVVDTGENDQRIALVNPTIVETSEEDLEKMKEGCLSIPGIEGEVQRPRCVKVRGLTVDNEEITLEADGFYARVLQHEIDHLNGVLFVDRLQDMERELLEGTLSRLAHSHQENR